MDADDADDITLLVNTPAQAESLLHSPEQAAEDIVLYMNTNKTSTRILIKKEPSYLPNPSARAGYDTRSIFFLSGV